MSSSIWSIERTQRLITLWDEGRTAAAIASLLGAGISRCAVLGKVHRLGLIRAAPCRPTAKAKITSEKTSFPESSRGDRKARAARGSVVMQARQPPLKADSGSLAAPENPAASILSVGRGQCRWPCGTPGVLGFSVCGGPVARGAYCAAHAAVGYQARPMGAEGLIRMAEAGFRGEQEMDESFI